MAQAMMGFQVFGAVAGALGQRAQAMNQSARAESEARLAETQALQRDTQARDELNRYLSGVRAARAANGLSAGSPNAHVLTKDARKTSDLERMTNRANDRQRAANFRTAAKGYRSSGNWSLATGLVKAAVPLTQHGMNEGWW